MVPRRDARIAVSAAITIAVAVAAPAPGAEAVRLGYWGSLQFSTGTYSTSQRSNGLYLFNGVALGAGRWRVSASLPLVAQSSPMRLGVGDNPLPNVSDGGPLPMDEIGVADPLLRTEYELLRPSSQRPSVGLNVQAKLPLSRARDSVFGTGEWDYGAGFSLSQRVGGGFVFADLTYWRLGDLEDLALQNPLAYGLSYGRPFAAGRFAAMATLAGFTRLLATLDPPVQVGASLGWWTRSRRSLTAGVAFGLTSSAPDDSFSIGWRLGG